LLNFKKISKTSLKQFTPLSFKAIYSNSSKLKFQPRWLKTKGSRLWFVKEIKTDGTIELESPYSRRTKVVIGKLLQQRGHPP